MKMTFNPVRTVLDSVVDWIRAARIFLGALIARPREVASVVPSSQELEDGLSRLVEEYAPSLVVELGPGTGGTTRALLRSLSADAKLIAIEIVPEFIEELRRVDDPRLIVCQGDAAELSRILSESEVKHVDLVVSGIPVSTMRPSVAKALVSDIHRSLAPGGRFVTYQVRDTVIEIAAELFNAPRVSLVFWNVPPLRLYQFAKPCHEKLHAHPTCSAIPELAITTSSEGTRQYSTFEFDWQQVLGSVRPDNGTSLEVCYKR